MHREKVQDYTQQKRWGERERGSESMVSLQAILSLEEKASLNLENQPLKKRKREERKESDGNFSAKEPSLLKSKYSKPDIELHLDTPLPMGWQRCLDIKSGQIHFYDTRTNKRTSKDPRGSEEAPTSCPSLDLELSLTFEPQRTHINGEERPKQDSHSSGCNSEDNSGSILKSLSWISLDADRREMVAAVCMRCHMLVMMCKATPSCPNCKFEHPPNHSSPTLLKPGFKLLVCKD